MRGQKGSISESSSERSSVEKGSKDEALPEAEKRNTKEVLHIMDKFCVNAPAKELPSKCAIKWLSSLFSPNELEEGILFQSKRFAKYWK